MKIIDVNTGRPYKVITGRDILPQLGESIAALEGKKYRKAALVCDDTVYALYGDIVENSLSGAGFEVCRFIFPAGEASKNMDTVLSLTGFLSEHYVTRSDLVVALGGGVCGDLAGFSASVYQRGIDFVQVPTSLLAMVDSSIGGKTAVNIPQGKNLIGSFWQPSLAFCDVNTLSTLPDEYYADGMAEVVKYGCIWDKELFSILSSGAAGEKLDDIISRCIAIKAEIVAKDEHDRALRQILNFGHTVGHAIEKLSAFTVTHGKAVAIGMYIMAQAGETAGIIESGTAARIEKTLELYNLPVKTVYSVSELAGACLGDKKRDGDSIGLITLNEIGSARVYPVEASKLAGFLGGI